MLREHSYIIFQRKEVRGEWTLGCVNRDTKAQKPKGPQKLTRARVRWSGKKSDAVGVEAAEQQEMKIRTKVMTLWWKNWGNFWKSVPNPRVGTLDAVLYTLLL